MIGLSAEIVKYLSSQASRVNPGFVHLRLPLLLLKQSAAADATQRYRQGHKEPCLYDPAFCETEDLLHARASSLKFPERRRCKPLLHGSGSKFPLDLLHMAIPGDWDSFSGIAKCTQTGGAANSVKNPTF